MVQNISRRLVMLIVLPLLAAAGTVVASTAPAQAVSSYTATLTSQVVKLTNAQRAKYGLPPVKANWRLAKAAQRHSWDMASKGYFSHTSPGGSTFVDRARAQGHRYPLAENIAYGYKSPNTVVGAFMKSPGHKKNILKKEARTIGVGVSFNKNGRPYWTQVFGYR